MWYSKGVIDPLVYYFNSYGDSSCESFLGAGSVQTTGVVSGDYTQVEVTSNTTLHDMDFVGLKYYILTDAETGGSEAYQLYTDAGTTGTGMYVKIYEEAPTHDISITVNDGTDPVQGATVVVGETSKTTGSAGGCTINGVTIGEHEITVTKTGFEDYSDTITVDTNNTTFTITLTEGTEEETTPGGG